MTARVLVVDDLPPNVKLLEAKLSSEYFEVMTACDGPSALESIANERPDIVLLDVMMPGMDGFEVCRRIKTDPKTAHIPVVMVTALSEVSDRVRGLEAGADDFLTKPVNDTALFARVRSLVRLKMAMDELRLRQDTSEQLGAMPNATEYSNPEDIADARMLFVEDSQTSARRIAEFAEQAGHSLTVTNDATSVPALAAENDFDLVLVSLGLKTGDPLRLTSQLRSQEETRSVPILLVIEEEDIDRLAKGLEIGINDYLVRPVDRQELLARVRTQIRRKRYQDRLRSNYRESLSLAVTDPLTGLYNRRYFDIHMQSRLEEASQTNKPLGLLMIDIDHFKTVNDSHGHAVGDQVLAEVARRVLNSVRNFDLVARLGGEEFVVVMPGTDKGFAMTVAERLRRSIADTPIPAAIPSGTLNVTISIGAAVVEHGELSAGKLLEAADEAMYKAKNQGRNQVVLAEAGRKTAAA